MSLPDAAPPPDPEPHGLPNPRDVWVEGTLPSFWQAQRMSASALQAMKDAEEAVRLRHEEHAAAEREYRAEKFRVAMAARGVEVDGKRLTDRERGLYVDAETAPMKERVRVLWGALDAARAAVRRADREQATVRAYADHALRIQARD